MFWGVQRKENHTYAKTCTIDLTLKAITWGTGLSLKSIGKAFPGEQFDHCKGIEKAFPGEQFYHCKGIEKSIPWGMLFQYLYNGETVPRGMLFLYFLMVNLFPG